ncbi:mitochondrial translation [Dimargaris xerosporica]|nr:mitochondrial translation [Dimargaris xerosporica]
MHTHHNEAETPAAHPPSMAKEGTVIKGLNYHTNQSDPIAKRDDEYPAWLWTLLDEPTGDQLSERLQLKKENKTKIKQANFMKKKK